MMTSHDIRWFAYALCMCATLLQGHARAQTASLAEDVLPAPSQPDERLYLELGMSFFAHRTETYVRRLHMFGWTDAERLPIAGAGSVLRAGLMANPFIGLHLEYRGLDARDFQRAVRSAGGGIQVQTYDWSLGALTLNARARRPLGRSLAFYGQAGGGLGIGFSRLSTEGERRGETGLALAISGGIQLNLPRWVGFFVEYGYTHALILSNRFGENRQSGGTNIALGLRLFTSGGW